MTLSVTYGDTQYEGEINIPANVDYKGKTFTVGNIGYKAFEKSKITKVVLPNTIKSISESAFNGCDELSDVELNEGLLTIYGEAFSGCSSLNEIVIPSTVTKIGDGAFYGNRAKRLIFKDGNENLRLTCGGGLYEPFYSDETEYIYLGRTLDIEYYDSNRETRACPFNEPNIKEFIIGNQVKYLPKWCLAYLGLTTLTIPSNVKSMGMGNIPKTLKTLIIEDTSYNLDYVTNTILNVTELYLGRNIKNDYKNDTFSESSCIEKLTIGKHVNNLDCICFSKNNLKEIYMEPEEPIILTKREIFNTSTYLHCTLYVPFGSKDKYANASGWKYFFDIREFDASSVENVSVYPMHVTLNNNSVVVTGLNDGEDVILYTLDGKLISRSQSKYGQAHLTINPYDKIVILKTKNKSIKLKL